MRFAFLPTLGAALVFFSSCATTIDCPPVEDAVKMALLDHGKHASVVLETVPGKMVRYGYGDWDYYALANKGVFTGTKALLWPTRAGLGRMELEGPVETERIQSALPVLVEETFVFRVDRQKALLFNTRLEEIYLNNRDSLHYNESYDLNFVHHPSTYWLFNNSNHKMADWAEELGCEAKGLGLLSVWKRP